MYIKGNSGNKGGRPVGSKDKATMEIRQKFKLLIENNFEQIEKDFAKLEPNERLKFYFDFARFVIPTLKSTEIIENKKMFFDPITININDE